MTIHHPLSSFNIVHMDPYYIYRYGLTASLSNYKSFNLIGSLSSFEDLERLLLAKANINVVLCEIYDARCNIAEGIKIIRGMIKKHPQISFILLTSIDNDGIFIQCGAHNHFLKRMQINRLINIISQIENRCFYLSEYNSFERELTDTELSILISFCHSHEIKQIGIANNFTYNYVSHIKRSIIKKLSLKNNFGFLRFIVFIKNNNTLSL